MEISNTELIIRMISKNRDISYLPLFAVRTDACSARCSGTMKRQKTDQAISMDMASASGETMKLANAVNYHTQWVGGFRAVDNITDVFHFACGQDMSCRYVTGHKPFFSGVLQSTRFSVNENGVGPFSENPGSVISLRGERNMDLQ